MEQVFETTLDLALDKLSPERKEKRREKRAAKKGQGATALDKAGSKKRTRHIPSQISDKVFVRDGGCCAFIGREGRRCGSKHDLEVHHKTAFAKGGESTLENLTLFCRAHNQHAAEKDFGRDFISTVIGGRDSSYNKPEL